MIDFASGGRLLDPHLQQLGDSSRVSGAQLQCTGGLLDPPFMAARSEMKGAWLDVKRGAWGQLARLQCARGCWVGPQTPLMGGPMLGLEGKKSARLRRVGGQKYCPVGGPDSGLKCMLRVIQGERPQRPAEMSEELWNFVTVAWAAESHTRPTIHNIVSIFPGSSTVTGFMRTEPKA
ncbi:hypothetical protein C8R44DRAFT_753864 [Mycena epipterygia]|nr:hypothetical protein C8R44DRAFT_753864 [Mycena epipterygia]